MFRNTIPLRPALETQSRCAVPHIAILAAVRKKTPLIPLCRFTRPALSGWDTYGGAIEAAHAGVSLQNLAQVRLAQDQDMIDALAPD
jgi:hypothetical protein